MASKLLESGMAGVYPSSVGSIVKEFLDKACLPHEEHLEVLREYLQYRRPQVQQRFYELGKSFEALEAWNEINRINGLAESEKSIDCIESDCLHVSQWSYVLPHSEKWIIVPTFFFKVVGLLPIDDFRRAQWKETFKNTVPLPQWMAALNCYEVGGFAFFGTKKCLWRQCVVAMGRLYKEACADPWGRRPFQINRLLEDWNWSITEESVAAWGNIGKGYLNVFEKDYGDNSLEPLYILLNTEEQTRVPLFENHILVIKNDVDSDVAAEARVLTRRLKWETQDYTIEETLRWIPDRPNEAKIIPQLTEQTQRHCRGQVVLDENTTYPPIGPTMFVPLDPMVSTHYYFKVIQRLEAEEGYVVRKGGEMHQLMELAKLLIQITCCTSPLGLWDLKFPSWFGETIPPVPGTSSSTIRRPVNTMRFQFFGEEERFARQESWRTPVTTRRPLQPKAMPSNYSTSSHSTQAAISSAYSKHPTLGWVAAPVPPPQFPANLPASTQLLGQASNSTAQQSFDVSQQAQEAPKDVHQQQQQQQCRTSGHDGGPIDGQGDDTSEDVGSDFSGLVSSQSSARTATPIKTPLPHPNRIWILAELQMNIDAMMKKLISTMDKWINEDGQRKAMDRLYDFIIPGNKQIGRLQAEFNKIDEEEIKKCDGQCFNDLRTDYELLGARTEYITYGHMKKILENDEAEEKRKKALLEEWVIKQLDLIKSSHDSMEPYPDDSIEYQAPDTPVEVSDWVGLAGE